MKENRQKRFRTTAYLFAAFVCWTAAVCLIDVRPIGPLESTVGLATFNSFIHNLTGVHMPLYILTDWLSLAPIGFMFGFALLGLVQWIRRKSLWKVDFSLLILGAFYIAVLASYLFFETFVINYRPVLINGALEASYPSSTTMLVLCVMPTAAMQLYARLQSPILKRYISLIMILFTAFMVIGRLIAGVHWISDIIGGVLLSFSLITLYVSIVHTNEISSHF